MKKFNLSKLLPLLFILAYPLLIWYTHGKIAPRWLALALLAMAVMRLAGMKLQARHRWLALAALLLAGCALLWNTLLPLKLYPVAINLGMLALFAHSLWYPPSIVERLARLQDPQLPGFAIAYTRRVTQVWCVFFVLNGSLAFATAMWASERVWSLYTGVISYLAMGLLFAGEYLVRLYVKRLHHA